MDVYGSAGPGLRHGLGRAHKADYGLNPNLEDLLGAQVVVLGMPSAPCRSETQADLMQQLKHLLSE